MKKWYIEYFLGSDSYVDCVFAESENEAKEKYQNISPDFRISSVSPIKKDISTPFHETDVLSIVSYILNGIRYTESWYLDKKMIEEFVVTIHPEATDVIFTNNKEVVNHIHHRFKGEETKKKNDSFALVIIIILAAIIACFLAPLIITINNFIHLKITKKQKEKPNPSGASYKKFRTMCLIVTIVHYLLVVLFIVLYKVAIDAFLNVALYYSVLGGLAFAIGYYLLSKKWHDKFYPVVDDKKEDKENKEEPKVEVNENNKENNDNITVVASTNTNEDNNQEDEEIDYDKLMDTLKIIKEYKGLLDSGIITEKEFNDRKKELLNL
ncbi:MAG: SHOCT domain-containing protein [Acholeplasmatales bacterium]|nr:SHOCT domain-containing protein [Acholeplasmatales bacterium]